MYASVDIKHDLRGNIKKSGGYPVKLQVIFNRKPKLYGTGIDLKEIEFKRIFEGKRLNNSDKETKAEIESFLNKANECIKELKDSFTYDRFEDLYLGNKGFADSLITAFQLKIDEYIENRQFGTSDVYKSAMNAFISFLSSIKKKDIAFGEIDGKLLKKYIVWLNENYSGATLSNYFQKLKTIYKDSIESGRVKIKTLVNPFYKITVSKQTKAKFALNEIEKQLFFNYKTEKDNHLLVIDLCKLSYHMQGINLADLAHAKFEQYSKEEKRFWFYRRKTAKKTANPKRIFVSLNDEAIEIIEKYKNHKRNIVKDKDFLFPFLDDEKDEIENKLRVNRLSSKIYEWFGVCPIRELRGKDITYYTFRRTFAVNEYQKTKDIVKVKNCLGHSTTIQTETYLQSLGIDTTMFKNEDSEKEKVS